MNRNYRKLFTVTLLLLCMTGCGLDWRREADRLETYKQAATKIGEKVMYFAGRGQLPRDFITAYNNEIAPGFEDAIQGYGALVDALKIYQTTNQPMNEEKKEEFRQQLNQFAVKLVTLTTRITTALAQLHDRAALRALEKEFENAQTMTREIKQDIDFAQAQAQARIKTTLTY